jgi:hypothetical protein
MLDAASWAVPLRAVGWLEHGHEFAVGVVPATLVARIERFLDFICEYLPNMGFRGLHECSLCLATGRHVVDDRSWVNLLIPGRNEVFAAPGGLVHYISDHSYLPPASFLEGVDSCPYPGSPRYLEALRDANAGLEPPVTSYAASFAQGREWFGIERGFRDSLGIPLMSATRSDVIRVARMLWPRRTFSDESESIELFGVRITFDGPGRVIEVKYERRPICRWCSSQDIPSRYAWHRCPHLSD